jgi:hypothetical protein
MRVASSGFFLRSSPAETANKAVIAKTVAAYRLCARVTVAAMQPTTPASTEENQ